MKTYSNLAGKKFGRWEVVRRVINDRDPSHRHWLCICSCDDNQTKVVKETSLTSGRSVSCGCYRIEKMPKGKSHYGWKEKGLGYFGVHQWLRKVYGKADRCENKNCLKKSGTFQWALLKGHKYVRDRKSYMMLCRSCHSRYDNIKRNLPVW